MRASVILAAYNAEVYLGRAIESALAQTEPSLELIVVDDVSRDGGAALVQAYGRRDGRVRLIQAPQNLGPGFARNLALAQARGEWVAILDADDAFLPSRLERLLALAEADGADVVADNLLLRNPDTGQITGKMFPQSWFGEGLLHLQAPAFVIGNMGDSAHPARLAYGYMKPIIRRRFLVEHDIQYRISRFAEDYMLYLELLCLGARWVVTPDAYYEYDIRPNSLAASVRGPDKQAMILAERNLMSEPEVQSRPDLQEAMQRHAKSTELSLAWDQFCDALKARKPFAALAAITSDGETAAHVSRQLLVHLGRTARRRLLRVAARPG